MQEIETSDLKIIALSFHQLSNYIEPGRLEDELRMAQNGRMMPEKVKAKIAEHILPAIKNDKPENIFSTFWIIIDKRENEIAAEFCFKGEPADGKAEIGYATFPKFHNRGIMTQALIEINNWIFKNTDLISIVAQTDPENAASIKVLQKSSFILIEADRENLIWERKKTIGRLRRKDYQ